MNDWLNNYFAKVHAIPLCALAETTETERLKSFEMEEPNLGGFDDASLLNPFWCKEYINIKSSQSSQVKGRKN